MATLEELTTPLTKEDVEAAIYAALAAKGAKTTAWKPGAVVRAIITGASIVASAFSKLQAEIARGGFLELAKADWRTLVAKYVFGVERDTGSFATSILTVENTAGGVFSGDPDDLVFSSSVSKREYRNIETFSIAAGPGTIVEIPVQAVEIGTASNAGTDEIDTFVTPLSGVIITGSTAAIGADEETDAALAERAREKTGTLSPNGPRDAYAFVAKGAKRTSGEAIGVTKVLTVPDGVGGIDVYVATPSGVLAGTAGDPATDLGAVADAVHKLAEPLGITPVVQNGTPVSQDVQYELWVRDTIGMTDAEILAAVDASLTSFFAEQPIGGVVLPGEPGRLYVDAIQAAITRAISAEHFLEVEVTIPAADVDITVPEYATRGTFNGTPHQVPGGTS